MVYYKSMQKNHPNRRFCVRNHRSKNVSEKFREASAPLAPPGCAYEKISQTSCLQAWQWPKWSTHSSVYSASRQNLCWDYFAFIWTQLVEV